MKAIILREHGSPENFEEVDLPIRPPKSDEVLVRIMAGSINPIDYKVRQGRIQAPLPLVLGHDCAGVVAAVGQDVRRFKDATRCGSILAARAATALTPSTRPCPITSLA